MLLRVTDLIKSYHSPDGAVAILNGISMAMDRGETLALTGESGSGKSTLLHLVGGLDQPDGGHVAIDGVDIGALDDASRAAVRRDKVGVIFQQFNLIPSLTVASNIAFQARLAGKYDADWVDVLIDRFGLTSQVAKYPEQLSGGQQQRVAIARALVNEPECVLMDEPTGNLDEQTGESVRELIESLRDQIGIAFVLVTHDMAMARSLGRVLRLEQGELFQEL